jgi:hypothetical protein
MLSDHRGEAASPQLATWAQDIARSVDPSITADVIFEDDSNTFILRLAKGARVLIFRLSASQVYTDGREAECERTLRRKIKDLWNML